MANMFQRSETLSAKKLSRVAKLVWGVLILTIAWWGLPGAGTGQPANRSTPAPGRVEGGSDVLSLGTSATGTIAELLVKADDHVQAGQHLLRVECRAIERELEARQSDLAASDAAFDRTLHGPRPEEIAIGVANVNLAEARLHEAEKQFERAQTLHEGVTITRVQIDQAERDARIAAAMLDEVRAKLVLLKVGSREEDIAEARSRRDAAKARVEETAARLGYCTVDAPINGVILSTRVSPGQLVSTMAPVTLMTMVDDSKRVVRAVVGEREIAEVCPGQPAHVSADGVPEIQFDGMVERVATTVGESPFLGNAPQQVRQVMVSVPEKQYQIPIGLRVSVQFSACPAAQKPTAK
jgi:multidrug resistance efflux pump